MMLLTIDSFPSESFKINIILEYSEADIIPYIFL